MDDQNVSLRSRTWTCLEEDKKDMRSQRLSGKEILVQIKRTRKFKLKSEEGLGHDSFICKWEGVSPQKALFSYFKQIDMHLVYM